MHAKSPSPRVRRHTGINSSTGTAYDIRFQGEAIVNAVISTLVSGPIGADPAVAADFYNTTVPNLQGAREIVLAGESADGGGLRHHLDRLNFDLLQPAVADPEVKIRAVVDAGAPPGLWDSGISWADPYSPGDYPHWALYATPDDFWSAQFAQLGLFAGYTPAAGGLEPPLAAPGVQGINCTRHVAIQTNDGFYAHNVTGPGVPARSFHDLLVAWLAGTPTGLNTVQIQNDSLGPGAYSASFCP